MLCIVKEIFLVFLCLWPRFLFGKVLITVTESILSFFAVIFIRHCRLDFAFLEINCRQLNFKALRVFSGGGGSEDCREFYGSFLGFGKFFGLLESAKFKVFAAKLRFFKQMIVYSSQELHIMHFAKRILKMIKFYLFKDFKKLSTAIWIKWRNCERPLIHSQFANTEDWRVPLCSGVSVMGSTASPLLHTFICRVSKNQVC